jgi:DDE superfamily endonuclease
MCVPVPPALSIRRRKRYTVPDKKLLAKKFKELVKDGKTNVEAAVILKVHHNLLLRWVKEDISGKFDEFLTSKDCRRVNRQALSTHPGRESFIAYMEETLLEYLVECRCQGMMVYNSTIQRVAESIDPDFDAQTKLAKEWQIRRFVKRHGYVLHCSTHESQRCGADELAEAREWMAVVRPKVLGPRRHPEYILNMDQTPVFFSMLRKKTLNIKGAKTVHVRKSTSDTKRITVAVTITAAGTILTPLMIFKGTAGVIMKKKGGDIENEFPTYNPQGLYACQAKAWMDQYAMNYWIEQILKPHLFSCPPGIHPILFLDQYKCHIMPETVRVIEELGCEVVHIPGGCTGLVQPVDVGLGKPLKNRVRNLWEQWMHEKGAFTKKFVAPSRQKMADWTVSSLYSMSEEIIRNCWRHHELGFFPSLKDKSNETNVITDESTADDTISTITASVHDDNALPEEQQQRQTQPNRVSM